MTSANSKRTKNTQKNEMPKTHSRDTFNPQDWNFQTRDPAQNIKVQYKN